MSIIAAPDTAADGAAQPKDALRLWLKLLRTARRVESEVRDRLRTEFNMTLPRFDVLASLARSGTGQTMTALSRHLLVSNGNVTGIVERLVTDGYVAREPDPMDRRSSIVQLTKEGRIVFDRMAAAHETWIAEFFATYSAADISKMKEILSRTGPAKNTGPGVADTEKS